MGLIVNRRWRPCGVLLLAAVFGCARSPSSVETTAAEAEAPRIELNTTGSTASFDVVGLSGAQLADIDKLVPQRRAAVFRVFVAGDQADPSPLLGDLSIEAQRLRFAPRFPLAPGLSYRAVLAIAKLPGANATPAADLSTTFAILKRVAQAPTLLEHIYPSADHLPENQLKFYLHFSAPMSRGESYRHIHLFDSSGKEVEAPFLELGEELWDPAMRRFTLLCDPGRVKRGLKPREELGPVLEEGKSYTLVIDRDWPDATGADLQDGFRKSFQALSPDEMPIDPNAWKIEPPHAGTIESLVVRFGESLDHSLLERVVWITNPAGEKVAGTIEISDDETCWRFRPEQAWSAGEHQLVANAMLEDLAGNAIGRPFDVDVFGPIQKTVETENISVPFTIGSNKPD
jgi:hypothetical protein